MKRALAPTTFLFRALLGIIAATQALGSTIILPAMPAVAAYFGTGAAQAQSTIGGFLLGVAAGQIFWGAMADRFGRRPVMLAGLALFSAAGLLAALSPSIGALFAFRALQGVGGAAGMIVGRSIVRDLFQQQDAIKNMSFIGSVTSLMPLVAPLVGGLLLNLFSWRGVLVFLSLLAAGSLAAAWVYMGESIRQRDPEATNPRRIGANIATFLTTPSCVWLTLVMVLIYGGMMSVMSTLPYTVIEVFGVPSLHAGWFIGAQSMAAFGGTRLASRLADRWKPSQSMAAAIGLAAGSSLFLLAVATSGLRGPWALALLMAPILSYGVAFAILQGNLIVAILQPVPRMAGMASAMAGSFQMAGGGLFVAFAGVMFDGTPSALGYAMALGGLGGTAAYVFAGRRYAVGAARRS